MAVGPASIYDISATRKRFDVNKQITQLALDASPSAVVMMRRKKVVDSEKFYWYDEEPASRRDYVRTAAATAEMLLR